MVGALLLGEKVLEIRDQTEIFYETSGGTIKKKNSKETNGN